MKINVKNSLTLRWISFLEWDYINSFWAHVYIKSKTERCESVVVETKHLRTIMLNYHLLFLRISKWLKYSIQIRILNSIVLSELKIFIYISTSIKIEKRRFSVFILALKSKSKPSVQSRQQKAPTLTSWIIYSDSEYGLLLSIQITDSYMLNVITKETLASQSSIWLWRVGWSGDTELHTICGLEQLLLLIKSS